MKHACPQVTENDRVTLLLCQLLSRVRVSATPWTAVCESPLAMKLSRQEYRRGQLLLFPGIELMSPALQAESLLSELPRKPLLFNT